MCLQLAGSPRFLKPRRTGGDGPVASELGEYGDQISVPAGDGEHVPPRTGRAWRGISSRWKRASAGPDGSPGPRPSRSASGCTAHGSSTLGRWDSRRIERFTAVWPMKAERSRKRMSSRRLLTMSSTGPARTMDSTWREPRSSRTRGRRSRPRLDGDWRNPTRIWSSSSAVSIVTRGATWSSRHSAGSCARPPRRRLWFVGPDRGFLDDHGRLWGLEEFVRDRMPGAIESGTVTLKGNQPFSSLNECRRRSRVNVICSRYETSSRVLIESMSMGCPLVVARSGGMIEAFEDNVDALSHRSEDPADLAAKIVALLNDPARAAQLGRQAAASSERKFHPCVIINTLVDFYRDTIERARSRKRGGRGYLLDSWQDQRLGWTRSAWICPSPRHESAADRS